MGSVKNVPVPDTRDTLLFTTGVIAGLASPKLLITAIIGALQSGVFQELIVGKVKNINDMSITQSSTATITAAVIIAALIFGIDKATTYMKKFGIGFVTGMILYAVIFLILGVDIPFVGAETPSPDINASNVTNSTNTTNVTTSNSSLPGL